MMKINALQLLYLCSGAMLGAAARWGIGLLLNPITAHLQLGTLFANYLGCFLMGILLAVMLQSPQFSPEWRLFLITGLLGSLTTFSAFCGEVVQTMLAGRYAQSISIILLHLCGSLFFTCLGVACWRYVKS